MEIILITSALALGLASSFHCVGMCGPIALSLGITGKNSIRFHLQNLAYQFGRIVTYSFLGAIIGILGQSFRFAGLQSYLSVFTGILIIVMALFSFGGKNIEQKIPLVSRLLLKVKIKLGKFIQRADLTSRFSTGLLNGLLPCGMVYIALTASLDYSSIAGGALFMFFFGLGTLPLMYVAALAGNILTQALRQKILKAVPFMIVILGLLFILRGSGIAIKYISPPSESLKIQNAKDHNAHGTANCCQ